MPLQTEEEYLKQHGYTSGQQTLLEPAPEVPGFMEAAKAAIRTSPNTMVNSYVVAREMAEANRQPFDPTFVLEDYLADAGQEEYGFHFMMAQNEQHARRISARVKEMEDSKAILRERGGLGFAIHTASDIIDPVNFVPFIGEVKVAKNGRRFFELPMAVAETAAKTITVQEAVAQVADPTRTAQETAVGIASGTALAGLLGTAIEGGSRAWSRYQADGRVTVSYDEATESFTDLFEAAQTQPVRTTIDAPRGSAGSMAFDDVPDDAAIQLAPSGRMAEFFGKLPAFGKGETTIDPFNTPQLRTLTVTGSEAARDARWYQLNLTGTPLQLKGELDNTLVRPDNVLESTMWEAETAYAPADQAYNDAIKSYRRRLKQEGATDGLTDIEIDREAYYTLATGQQHAIPEVNEIAAAMRDNISKPFGDKLIDEEILPDTIKSETYAPVSYSTHVIKDNQTAFQDIVSQYIARETAEAEDILPTLEADVAKFKKQRREAKKVMRDLEAANAKQSDDYAKMKESLYKIEDDIKKAENKMKTAKQRASRIDEAEFRDVAINVTRKLMGQPASRPHNIERFDFSTPSTTSSFLKDRVFDWSKHPDLLKRLIDEGMIDTDMRSLMYRYARSVSADLNMLKKFGDIEGEQWLRNLEEKYDVAIRDAEQSIAETRSITGKKAGDAASVRKLRREKDQVLNDLRMQIKRITGRLNSDPARSSARDITSSLKSINTMRFMLSMVEGSMPDAGKLAIADVGMQVHKGVIKNLVNSKMRNVSKANARLLGSALEHVGVSRSSSIADTVDEITAPTAGSMARRLSRASSVMLNLAGANHYNNFMKTWSTNLVEHGFGDAVKSIAAGGSPRIKARLNAAGFTDDIIDTLAKQINKHGETVDGVLYPRAGEWDNTPEVAKAFDVYAKAVRREVDILIVTPGGDKPLVMSTDLGSALLQFQSFAYSTVERTMLLYAQRLRNNPKDLATISAIVSQISIGIGTVAFKLWAAGTLFEETKDWGLAKWVTEGIDRSGLTGPLFNWYNLAQLGIDIPGLEPTTRTRRMQGVQNLAGPSAGLIFDALGTTGMLTSMATGQKPTQSQVTSAIRLTPLQSMLGIKHLVTRARDAAFEELDIPKERSPKGASKSVR